MNKQTKFKIINGEAISFEPGEDFFTTGQLIIPDNIKILSPSLFENVADLKEVILNNFITAVPSRCFKDCINLKKVVLGENINVISEAAFYGCELLKEINFNSHLQELRDCCFVNCKSVETLNIPSSIVYIADSVFEGCTNLKTITVDERNECFYSNNSNVIVRKKDDCLILGCQNSTIFDGVKSIKYRAFYKQHGLKNIAFPLSLQIICDEAFYQTGLEDITITKNITEISETAFSGNRIKKITVDADNQRYSSSKLNCLVDNKNSKLILASDNSLFDEKISSVGSFAFSNVNTKKIVLPMSVREICAYAFANCKAESIDIPKEVFIIERNAFLDCENLKTVFFTGEGPTIDGFMEGICEGAFNRCHKLENIIFHGTDKEWEIFNNDTSLKKIISFI